MVGGISGAVTILEALISHPIYRVTVCGVELTI